MDHFKSTFFQECGELLGKLEHALGALSGGATDAANVNEAFRTIHSIKGGAGMFGFRRLVAFAHELEGVLDEMRSGRVQVSAAIIERLLIASDVLTDVVKNAENGQPLSEQYEADVLKQLAAAITVEHSCSQGAGSEQLNSIRDAVSPGAPAAPQSAKVYRVTFAPSGDMLRRGIDPLRIIRDLLALGQAKVIPNVSRLPGFEELDPGVCYLSWTVEFETAANLKDVRDVFEFVEGSCQLEIGLVQDEELNFAAMQLAPVPSTQHVLEQRAEAASRPAAADAGAPSAPPVIVAADRRISSIRVDLERVDKLVNLVGEIVISQSMVLQQLNPSLVDSNPLLYRSLSQLLQHTRNLQDSVMAIRAQPVRSIFSRLPRVVRDVMQVTGKKVVLEMSGEETEIDKTIIEELADPLLHIIRNAIDHGIETEEQRIAAGKPAQGTIRVSAAQRGSRIVIQVSDDGRGIDRQRVRARALEMKLISADALLSDDEIDNLIFLPGFSTADSVSSISGRGVGMDVVLSNIQKVGGRVSLRSELGRGTVATLTLPLTLAVMDGMVVRSAGATYLIPLNNIVECHVVARDKLKSIPGFGSVVNIRGNQVRIIELAGALGIAAEEAQGQVSFVLVETEGSAIVGIQVDEIVGQQQVVVKSVRQNFCDVDGVAGATILGDGGVALILDVSAICEAPGSRAKGFDLQSMNHSQTGVRAA